MQSAQHQTHIAPAVSESPAPGRVEFGHWALHFSAEEIEQSDG
jgi:hypothetical protein